MMSHFFSASQNAFLAAALEGVYKAAGNWPEDVVEVSDDVYKQFSAQPPTGKKRGARSDGLPCWVDMVAQPPTLQQVIAKLEQAVQGFMDAAARAAGYEDIKSAVTYADEPAVPKFQAEGRAMRQWRSLVWARCYELLAQVQAGQRGTMTAAEVIAELPPLELPS